MDPLAALLRGPRAQEAFVLRMVMSPPWSVRVQDQAPLTLVAVLAGEVWLTPTDAEAQHLPTGRIAVVRGPDPYDMSDRPGRPTGIVVHPGQRCEDLAGRLMVEPFTRGVRTWGNDPAGGTVVIVGTYEQIGELGRRLLGVLPPLLTVDGALVGPPVVDLIAGELTRDVPGQGVVLDRLLDLATVSTLRCWFEAPGTSAPRWWQAYADPVAGAALKLLQHNPGHPWTVASLAREVGVSRATLARQFRLLVGQAPMAFLADWRMALAADLLLEPGATVAGVARQVGYGSGFAFSSAFKRLRGLSPSRHQARAGASRT